MYSDTTLIVGTIVVLILIMSEWRDD